MALQGGYGDWTSVEDDNYKPPRQLLAQNPTACDFILNTITSSIKLQIGSSLISIDAGNGLFTRQSIAAGQEIYRSEPLITCVDATNPAICHFCLHDSASTVLKSGTFRSASDAVPATLVCGGCKIARFCSKDCQRSAWRKFHRYECKIIAKTPLPPRSLAFFRLLLQHKHGKLSEAHWRAVEALQTNFHGYSDDEKAFVALTALAEQAEEKTQHCTPAYQLWALVCAIITNCIAIRPAEKKQSLGVSLDLVTSLINHDCSPNTHIFFEGNELRARSLRPISEGEELTRCYCDPTMDVQLRQQVLTAEQFFECKCMKCTKELKDRQKLLGKGDAAPKSENLIKAQRDILDLIQSAGLAVTKPGMHKGFEDLGKVESKLRWITSGAFPTSHWPDELEPLPSARMALGILHVKCGESLEALRLMLRGCMLSKRDRIACGAEWVNEMVDLTSVLLALGSAPADAEAFDDSALPDRSEVRTVAGGYLFEMSKMARRIFGDAKYSRAIDQWYEMVLTAQRAPPGSEGFDMAFRRAQAKLLLWAGVDKFSGVKLTS